MRIAGGMFGLEWGRCAVQPHFMRDPKLLLLSVRCGIKLLVDTLEPSQVWMPSYLCCAMLEAVDPAVSDLRFYEVGYDLEITSLDWLDALHAGDLVVLIDYFGFPCDKGVAKEVQARGALVLEDASQALLSTHVGSRADYVLFSPRKTVGVPDGGILQGTAASLLPPVKLGPPPGDWWLTALEASVARREFDRFGGDRQWYALFRESENSYPTGSYRMSELSEMLLESAFDYEAIAEARRENYAYLAESLTEVAIFQQLDAETVPLGFPIRIQDRDNVLQFLFDEMIFPPVHWELGEHIPREYAGSHRLSAHIMTIPCDQRLDLDDMAHISALLQSVLDAPAYAAGRDEAVHFQSRVGEQRSASFGLVRGTETPRL